ncbi:hypothetical protein ILYODFUR_032105 [Ilyodon furcidens]|uniref:Uncharacterized protein n=1 Tax=Ilyodon furcidens TaxID=33524 RepID=A0ABV0SU05_9TELE
MKSAMTKEKEEEEEEEYNVITVKTESDPEQQTSSTEEDEDSNEEHTTNGCDLNVLIKEEPHLLEIGEDYCEDTSSCLDTESEALTDRYHPEGLVKTESDFDLPFVCDSDGAPVKEEADSWFKEERESEEEPEDGEEDDDLGNLQEEFEEEEGVCTGP